MIYLLVFLAFSLFILLPVKIHIIIFKKRSDEYIRVELDCFKLSEILFEIPVMKLTMKNFIPILSFEYYIENKSNSIPKSEKIAISPLRERYKKVINMIQVLCKHRNLKKMIRFLSKYINVLDFNIDIIFGCENAALTGILAGLAWSVIYSYIRTLSFYLNFDIDNTNVNVTPVFIKHEPLQLDINCIFRLRVGHIIIASSIVAWYLLLTKRSLSQKVA